MEWSSGGGGAGIVAMVMRWKQHLSDARIWVETWLLCGCVQCSGFVGGGAGGSWCWWW